MFTAVAGMAFNFIVMMALMMWVAWCNLLRVSVVVSTFLDDIVSLGLCHSEVQRTMLLVFVMVGVVFVSVDVFTCQMVVTRVLVVMRDDFCGLMNRSPVIRFVVSGYDLVV